MFQHVVFGICRLIDVLVPDIPESLELKIKRERYLAKQALQDSDTIMKVLCTLSSRTNECTRSLINSF
jgi:anoctamin-7